jgi:hypothetical protein
MEKLLVVDYINLEVTDYYVCKVNLYIKHRKKMSRIHPHVRYVKPVSYSTVRYGTVPYRYRTGTVPYRTVSSI